jgi:group I intron endonuclease
VVILFKPIALFLFVTQFPPKVSHTISAKIFAKLIRSWFTLVNIWENLFMELTSNNIPAATGIYKITCQITSKSYIGQAHNIKTRIKQHLWSTFNQAKKDYNVPFHAAIRKYGIENFDLVILETCEAADLNSQERYWIKLFNTYIHSENSAGYNVTEGGKQSVRRPKLSPDLLNQVYDLLRENVLTYNEIASKFDITASAVKKINAGKVCYDSAFTYPLRDNSACRNKHLHRQKFGGCRYTGAAVEQRNINTGTLIKLYPSSLVAANALGDRNFNKHITNCCAGRRKTAYGYVWKFREISEQDWEALF